MPSLPPFREPFQFGPWTVDPALLTVSGPAGVYRLEPKIMHVLEVLVAGWPGVVTREEVLDTVWCDVVVGDDVLTRAVSELRRVFGDTPRNSRIIETIPSRGYRWIPAVDTTAPNVTSTSRESVGWRSGRLALTVVVSLFLGAIGYRLVTQRSSAPFTESALAGRPLTTEPGMETDPMFSPDESTLVYAAYSEGDEAWAIRTRHLESDAYRDIVKGIDGTVRRFPVWSPAGDSVAFAEMTDDGCRISRTSAQGGPVHTITECTGRVTGMTWSPDGSTLVFSEASDPHETGSVISVALGTGERQVILSEPGYAYRLPSFAPDGGSLALARAPIWGRYQPVITHPDGTDLRALTDTSFVINGLTWTPDGAALLLTSYEGTSYTVWEMPVDTDELQVLATGAGSVSRPSFGATSGRLAFVDWSYDTNIRTGVDGTSRLVESSALGDILPEWSADGTQLAFVSERSGTPELWVRNADGTSVRRITDGRTYFTGPIQWSPDGTRIGFSRMDPASGMPMAWVVDIASGRLDPVPSDGPSLSPFWMQDHDRPWFTSRADGSWYLHDPNGVRTDLPARIARWTGVDDIVLVVRSNVDGLWKASADGSVIERLSIGLDALRAHTGWTVKDNVAAVAQRPEGGATPVVIMNLASTRSDTVWVPGILQDNSGLSMPAGPESVHYVLEDRRESTIMITLPGL